MKVLIKLTLLYLLVTIPNSAYSNIVCDESKPECIGFRRAKPNLNTEYLDLPTIETDYLILRKINLSDAKDMFEFTSDPEIEDCSPVDRTIEDTKKNILQTIEDYKSYKPAPWAIVHKTDNKVIGYCGLFELDFKNYKGTIGFSMSKKYQNKGYMQEALKAVVPFIFQKLKLNKIEARAHTNNLAAMHILKKLGFKCEGKCSEFEYIKGGFQDIIRFSILKQDYISA